MILAFAFVAFGQTSVVFATHLGRFIGELGPIVALGDSDWEQPVIGMCVCALSR
jgi:hypothetical protein